MRITLSNRRSNLSRRKVLSSVAGLAVASLVLVGCANEAEEETSTGGDSSSSSTNEVIKIGYVHPKTGAYAGFSDGDDFVLRKINEYLENGLEIDGVTYDVEILARDSGSDAAKAGELAAQLITEDEVDLILATSTPETVNPVVAQCEANAVPCLTTIAPWQAVTLGAGYTEEDPFQWTNHFFFGIEGFADTEPNAWDQLDTNKVVGVLWPNDADGGAFRASYGPFAESYGYTIVDPGAYENGTQDFTSIINTFKENNVEIIAGVPIPPDFVNFWTQSAQQGFEPKAATVGKALFFPATVPSIPNDLGVGLGFASWWGPTFPYESSLDGTTPPEWIEEFESSPEGEGLIWNQATPLNYSVFELAIEALISSGDPFDKAAVNEAAGQINMMTLSGELDFTDGPFPGVAVVPTVVGQWEKTADGEWQWLVVDNAKAPEVPVDRGFAPLR